MASRRMAELLGATPVRRTPPPEFDDVRSKFHRCGSPLLTRSMYYTGNYVFQESIVDKSVVVLDRLFYSSGAYGMATVIQSIDQLPPVGAAVYQWPEDLVAPAMVFHVVVSPEKRDQCPPSVRALS